MAPTTTCAAVVVGAQRPRCHPNRQHLSAAPLLQAVSSYANRRQLSWEVLFDPAARRALQRARQSGEMTLLAVEDFCDRLGLHPVGAEISFTGVDLRLRVCS
jgi:hypothetical protein